MACYSMRIGLSRPRALATLLAGLLTSGLNAGLASSRRFNSIKGSDMCKAANQLQLRVQCSTDASYVSRASHIHPREGDQ